MPQMANQGSSGKDHYNGVYVHHVSSCILTTIHH